MMNQKTILLLGSSGWVAHYVIPELINNNYKVVGISNSKNPFHDIENYNCDIHNSSYIEQIKKIECDAILNMTHAKDYERAVEFHCEVADYCKETDKYYAYTSSSNAVDGDPTKPHYEKDLAFGGSDYGKHKAKCEQYLYENMPEALIIRFPATHGYAPNRVARTESFLKQLKNGEIITCSRGIIQCRPYVEHLAKMIVKAIFEKEAGIFHMSATTMSEEVDFLKNVAEAFGYSKDRVIPGEQLQFNLSVLPGKIYEKYGDEYKFTEEDTITMLSKCPELAKYKNE